MLKLVKSALFAAVLSATLAVPFAAHAEDFPAPKTKTEAAPKADAHAKCHKPAKGEKCDKGEKCCKNSVEVSVTGMHCAACSAKVKAALEKVEGVKRAEVCFKAGKACVFLKPKAELTQAAAEKALADLKEFKVTGVEKCDGKKCDGKKCDGKKCEDKQCDGKQCAAKKGKKALKAKKSEKAEAKQADAGQSEDK